MIMEVPEVQLLWQVVLMARAKIESRLRSRELNTVLYIYDTTFSK